MTADPTTGTRTSATLFGMPLDAVTMDEAVARCRDASSVENR